MASPVNGYVRKSRSPLENSTGPRRSIRLPRTINGCDDLAVRRGFGRTCSPLAFGHAGAGGQIAWADPASGLSFCYLSEGLDANLLREGRRRAALCNRAGALVDVTA